MSTAVRLDANVQAPIEGRIMFATIANGASVTVDLDDPALLPAGLTQAQKIDFWRSRFLRISVDGGTVHFAASKDLLPPLALGYAGVGAAFTVPLDVGIPIFDRGAPEMLFLRGGSRYLKFSNDSGGPVTVAISTSSESAEGAT